MCGSPYNPKFHYPLCPKCRTHHILSRFHIQCRHCAAKRKGKHGRAYAAAKKAAS